MPNPKQDSRSRIEGLLSGYARPQGNVGQYSPPRPTAPERDPESASRFGAWQAAGMPGRDVMQAQASREDPQAYNRAQRTGRWREFYDKNLPSLLAQSPMMGILPGTTDEERLGTMAEFQRAEAPGAQGQAARRSLFQKLMGNVQQSEPAAAWQKKLAPQGLDRMGALRMLLQRGALTNAPFLPPRITFGGTAPSGIPF